MDTLNAVSFILSLASFLFPLAIGFKRRRSLLWIYILTGFAFDIALIILKRHFHVNIFPFANLYVITDFILLSLYYYKALSKGGKYFLPFVTLIAVTYVVHTIMNGVMQRNGVGAAYFNATFLLYALLGFYGMSRKEEPKVITESSFFWVNVAILTSSAGRVVLFLFEDYLIASNNIYLGAVWIIYRMLNILVNVLFAVALTRKYD